MFRFEPLTDDAPRASSATLFVPRRTESTTRTAPAGLVDTLFAALAAARPGRGD